MKRNMFFIASICVLTLIFSGCSGNFFDNEYIDIVITDSERTDIVTDQTLGYETVVTSAEEPDIFSDIVESFPIDNILLPDGSTVDKHEAVRAVVEKNGLINLEFDFWFMRYAKPIVWSNIEGLGEYREKEWHDDWKKSGEEYEKAVNIKYEDYFRVESGDILDNNMKVVEAGFTVYGVGGLYDSYVELSGESTYEGLIVRYEEDVPYNDKGDIVLVPDPTKDTPIPIAYLGGYDKVKYGIFGEMGGSYTFGESFIMSDSIEITLGNEKDLPYKFDTDFNDIFTKDPRSEIIFSYARAKGTIRNMNIRGSHIETEVEYLEIADWKTIGGAP